MEQKSTLRLRRAELLCLVQGDRWLAIIQLNGEFTSIQQERILEGLLEPLAALIKQESKEAT